MVFDSRPQRFATAILVLALFWIPATRAQVPQGALPLDPPRERGASVTPAYEGWYENPDGTFTFLVGYFNRNTKQPLEIPIGPNNKIEPGNPDQGQPTYFATGRQWGVFTIKVPKDFGKKTLTWTIVANGEKQSVPFTLNPGYPISPFKELGMGNQPPAISFAANGPKFTGPPVGVSATLTGTVGQPVTISVWAEDVKTTEQLETARGRAGAAALAGRGGPGRGGAPDGRGAPRGGRGAPGGGGGGGAAAPAGINLDDLPDDVRALAEQFSRPVGIASLSFHKFRGPGTVTFNPARTSVMKAGESVSTAATFSAPGEYTVRVQANDESGEGGGGFQCCWTNAHVKIVVK
jgi:hypothetical protein